MLFISVQDFLEQAAAAPRLSRAEEKELAVRMRAGDESAREKLVRSYFPLVAAHIRRAPQRVQTLHSVYSCIKALDLGVDQFNFLQEGETFAHHLAWRERQCLARCIACEAPKSGNGLEKEK